MPSNDTVHAVYERSHALIQGANALIIDVQGVLTQLNVASAAFDNAKNALGVLNISLENVVAQKNATRSALDAYVAEQASEADVKPPL